GLALERPSQAAPGQPSGTPSSSASLWSWLKGAIPDAESNAIMPRSRSATGVTQSTTDEDLRTSAFGTSCSWSTASEHPLSVSLNAGAVLGAHLYSFGGSAAPHTAASYQFNGTAWSPIASLPEPRWGAAAVSDGTYIYILGGVDQNNFLVSTVFRYNPSTNTYTVLADMPLPRAFHSAAYLNGKIHLWGGTTDGVGP